MIVIKTLLGISIIMIAVIALYVIGRITIPRLDPQWRRFTGTQRFIIIMLAGIVGIAAVGLIGIACVLGYAVGEAVMQSCT